MLDSDRSSISELVKGSAWGAKYYELLSLYDAQANLFEKLASIEPDEMKRLEFERALDDVRSNKKTLQQIVTTLNDWDENKPDSEKSKIEQKLHRMILEIRLATRRNKRFLTSEVTSQEKMSRSERLLELFDNPNGKTQASLARFCNVTAPAVALWVKNGAFTYENAVKIANFFGVNPEWLYSGKGDKLALPIVHEVTTATNPLAVLDVEIRRGDDWLKINQPAPVAFNKDYLGSEAIFAETCRLIRAQGDRMTPTIKAGEFLLVNEAEKHVISGSIYAVSVNGEFLLCQISRITDGIRLHYANSNYPDEDFTNEMMSQVSIIGRVVMSVRQF